MKTLFSLVALMLSFPAYAYGPYVVQVVRVIDGDTLDVTVNLWPGLSQSVSVRLSGVDTPEMKGPTQCERDLAAKARNFVVDTISNTKTVEIEGVKLDKYAGRVDALVSVDGHNLSALLMQAGFAKPYNGGKRAPWCP